MNVYAWNLGTALQGQCNGRKPFNMIFHRLWNHNISYNNIILLVSLCFLKMVLHGACIYRLYCSSGGWKPIIVYCNLNIIRICQKLQSELILLMTVPFLFTYNSTTKLLLSTLLLAQCHMFTWCTWENYTLHHL